ncbi:hypothetical protein CPB84DRAFT_1761659 [Gymnopilus junonius]|uniref:Uncharacterized protein n=1 Tax=Gymnopilus junonius TaxID=109634 RepID=A0A9P5P2V4_GYMJU|nr:hypothetical protein CPB84DRAFT_1761659 [Gymnopilus junonius]
MVNSRPDIVAMAWLAMAIGTVGVKVESRFNWRLFRAQGNSPWPKSERFQFWDAQGRRRRADQPRYMKIAMDEL